MRRSYWTILLSCAFFAVAVGGARAEDPASIQLVGTFNGITCEPTDPANDMDPQGNHVWRKLKFINEPGDPDTIFFKFTKNGSYLPQHWGWSGTWGIAELAWSPPSIAKVLPDSGYYYFYFNDADYTYWLDRPAGSITGAVSADGRADVPAGTAVTLFDAAYNMIGSYDEFTDSTSTFDALGPAVYEITVHAPGYRDTTITGIDLGTDETRSISDPSARADRRAHRLGGMQPGRRGHQHQLVHYGLRRLHDVRRLPRLHAGLRGDGKAQRLARPVGPGSTSSSIRARIRRRISTITLSRSAETIRRITVRSP